MTEYLHAWQCVGCGRIEAPQPCIGVCQDRKVQLVSAQEHEGVLSRARRLEQRLDILDRLVRKLALTTPRNGQWEQCYRALQQEAARATAALASGEIGALITAAGTA